MVRTLAGATVTSYQHTHSHLRAHIGSCPHPIYTKWALSPCLFSITGLVQSSSLLPFPQSKVLLGISLTSNYRQSKLEVALRGTGRTPQDVRELGPADVLCLRPTSGWACSAKGSKEPPESGWTGLQIQVWRWYLSRKAHSKISDLHVLIYLRQSSGK